MINPIMIDVRGPYVILNDGLPYHFEHPRKVSIETIAYALARIPRYTGNQRQGRFYSVAAHSCLVSDVARQAFPAVAQVGLIGLLHDIAEVVIGDMSGPFKAWLPTDAREALDRASADVTEDLLTELGLELEHWDPAVSMVDKAVVAWEAPRVLHPDAPIKSELPDWWPRLFDQYHLWTPEDARQEFLLRFRELTRAYRHELISRA